MKKSMSDIILHPVRMKIIQELVGKTCTTYELSNLLLDVPQPSLYRHLHTLVKANVIEVVEVNQVRGTVEKVYGLVTQNMNLTVQEIENMSKEEHSQMFLTFIANVMKDFETYVSSEGYNFIEDGLTYRQAGMYLSDQEFIEFAQSLGEVYQKYLFNEPSPERKRRSITTIIIPEKKRDVE